VLMILIADLLAGSPIALFGLNQQQHLVVSSYKYGSLSN
jgi:hypothetical protein